MSSPTEVMQPEASVEDPAGTPPAETLFPNSELAPELQYKPIPAWAPVSCLAGVVSVVAFATVYALIIPVLGVLFAVLAIRLIRDSGGAYGGWKLSLTGLTLSFLCLVGAPSWHAYVYATEVPEGYGRRSFQELASYSPIKEDGRLRIAEEAKALDGQKLFVKGYMYPTGQMTGIQSFVLCKDTGECCFGGKPNLTDMILVDFVNDVRAKHRELQLVNVAGTFRAKQRVVEGQLVAIYSLEAEYFK